MLLLSLPNEMLEKVMTHLPLEMIAEKDTRLPKEFDPFLPDPSYIFQRIYLPYYKTLIRNPYEEGVLHIGYTLIKHRESFYHNNKVLTIPCHNNSLNITWYGFTGNEDDCYLDIFLDFDGINEKPSNFDNYHYIKNSIVPIIKIQN